jgi:streptogramin lyase
MENYDDGPTGIVVDPSGNVYVTGRSGIAPFYYQYATIKYSPSGAQKWVRTYLGPGCISSEANDIAIDDQSNIYVTGQSYDTASATYFDYATIKYDSAGVQQWVARYNGPADNSDLATSIAVDGQSKVYVTGYSTGSDAYYDYATIKYFQFLRGDVNGDGVINAADVVYLINYLFISGPAPVPLEAGDVNCDGTINAADVVYLINYLFIGGPPPC